MQKRRTSSVLAKTACNLLVLTAGGFRRSLELSPGLREQVEAVLQQRREQREQLQEDMKASGKRRSSRGRSVFGAIGRRRFSIGGSPVPMADRISDGADHGRRSSRARRASKAGSDEDGSDDGSGSGAKSTPGTPAMRRRRLSASVGLSPARSRRRTPAPSSDDPSPAAAAPRRPSSAGENSSRAAAAATAAAPSPS